MKWSWRIWLMIIALALSILAISPTFESGVVVKSIAKNSPLFEQGLRQGDIIKEVNGMPIESITDYNDLTKRIFTGGDVRIDVVTKDSRFVAFVNETPDMIVQDIPRTKIKTGLDIQGGARALVQPEQAITNDQLQDLIAISNNRFNVFGLSDVKIRGVTDLTGNRFMLIEVAGATPSDLEELISQQGKFEARIGNQTVFSGGSQDITSVCRNDASCAGITGCSQIQGGYACNFRFTIYLSEESARRHADITNKIDIDMASGGQYLKGNLSLLLDNQVVDELLISRDLKGQVTTQISIQGSGRGATQEDALTEARASMHQLQTVLITGSLPYKLNIVKLDTIAPLLGGDFVYTLLIAGSVAILAVGLVILLRYRNIKESLAVLFNAFAEIVIILGVAALIGWNLDLPSIAGILATIGTGVNQQIIILDEARRSKDLALRARMKRALFVVFSAYATALVSLLPLYWASAGLFKGFAVTTIIGITAGVLISRPAFAAMIENIEN
jgi:preprotein translocase subunit SecD